MGWVGVGAGWDGKVERPIVACNGCSPVRACVIQSAVLGVGQVGEELLVLKGTCRRTQWQGSNGGSVETECIHKGTGTTWGHTQGILRRFQGLNNAPQHHQGSAKIWTLFVCTESNSI